MCGLRLHPPLRVDCEQPQPVVQLDTSRAREASVRQECVATVKVFLDEFLLTSNGLQSSGTGVIPIVVAGDEYDASLKVFNHGKLREQPLLISFATHQA
jgi:hypothetical protein